MKFQRSVISYLASVFLLEVGITAQFTALGKRVFDISGHELDLGLLGLAEFVPVALLVLAAGAAADRFDRRRVGALALTVEALVSFALIAVVQPRHTTLGPILALVLVYASTRAFLAPALRSLPANIVEPESLPRLVALNSAMWQGGVIVGPVLGGMLYTIDVWVPFAASAAFLMIAAVLILTVTITQTAPIADSASLTDDVEPTHGGRLSEALSGLRVIRHEPLLLGAISLDLFAVLFGGAVALLPAIAEKRLGVDVVGLGWLRAAGGIGAALTTTVLAIRPLSRHIGPTLFIAVGVFGVATIAFGLTTNFALAFIALLILASADSISVFIRSTLVPLITPDAVRGRVSAVENVFIGASNELGAFESGLAGQLLGAPGAIVLGGIATIVVVVAWSTLFPGIRSLDAFPAMASVQ